MNRIEGFSRRYVALLNVCGAPTQARYTWGSKVCDTTINTFRNWCVLDTVPRSIADLPKNTKKIFDYQKLEIEDHNLSTICAWLVFDVCAPRVHEIFAELHVKTNPNLLGERA